MRQPDDRADPRAREPVDLAALVKDALAHLHDLPYLQTHPLMTFVQRDGTESARPRGRALHDCLIEAITALAPGPGKPTSIAYDVLRLRYVEALGVSEAYSRLGISRAEFYREHQPALAAVVAVLRDRWGLPATPASSRQSPIPLRLTPAAPRPTPAVALPSVPRYLTSFVGREADLVATTELLAHSRLLTLSGPGGCGKTRLAFELAARVEASYEDGAAVVDLSTITQPDLTLAAIATALRIDRVPASSDADQVRDALRLRHLLLVLDNFEQLLPAGPALVDLLHSCPRLTILVTSRAPLRVRGEQEFPVSPLELPNLNVSSDLGTLAANPAVALFVDRARASDPAFSLKPENAREIAEICCRLDGLPLAIELTAAWTRVLAPRAILARHREHSWLLAGGPRDLPARQRTLRTTLDWSYELLTADEKTFFRRLGVFSGGFTLEAAERVCGDGRAPGLHPLEGVASLVDKSLLEPEKAASVEPRFRMLETVREYAWERLVESREADGMRRAHAEYFLQFAEEAEPRLREAEQVVWFERVAAEVDNFRAALGWAQGQALSAETGLRLAGALWWFWYWRGLWTEGHAWLESALARAGSGMADRARARALAGLGAIAGLQGDLPAAQAALEESQSLARELGDDATLALSLLFWGMLSVFRSDIATGLHQLADSLTLAREAGDPWIVAWSLHFQGDLAAAAGDLATACARHEESLAIRRTRGDTIGMAFSLHQLGKVAYFRADYPQARELTEESLGLFRSLDHRTGVAADLLILGQVARHENAHDRAEAHLRDSLTAYRELGSRGAVAECLVGFASLCVAQGELARATRLLAAADVLYQASNSRPGAIIGPEFEREVANVRSQLDDVTFAGAWSQGQAMTLEQVIVYALE